MNEATVQAKVRIEAAKIGWKLWRNNSGVLEDRAGRPVRYGLANDSAQVNAGCKSADLIGIRPVLITQGMVGHIIGQFVSVECKHSDWSMPKTPSPREAAQNNWLRLVTSSGGYAIFTTGEIK